MRIAILGYAREGKAAYEYWRADGHEITVCDMNEHLELPAGADARLGPDHLKGLAEFDLLVRTAVLKPKDIAAANPETPDILNKVTTNINEFLRVCPSKNIIGVTGTKGKGTTSTLIAKIFEADGKKVHLGGNIGVAPLEMLKNNIQPEDWVVLEEGAFQLVDQRYSPHIAVCLMIASEHIDWFGNMEDYVKSKENLFAHQKPEDVAIYYASDNNSQRIASAGQGRKIPYFTAPGAYIEDSIIKIDGQTICSTDELKLLGQHNRQNVCAAITAVWQVTQNTEAIRSILTNFSGLEHRLELVRELDGIRYYNDSFSSAPPAAAAALDAIDGMKVVIVGGFDRNLNLEDLTKAFQSHDTSVRKVVLIGAAADRIANVFKAFGYNNYEISRAQTMKEIVDHARSLAQSGDAVVLSPGFPSFDMFKDFEQRGLSYKSVVNEL